MYAFDATIRLETAAEYCDKIDAMAELDAMLKGLYEEEDPVIATINPKAPEADYTKPGAKVLVDDRVVSPTPSDWRFSMMEDEEESIPDYVVRAYYYCNLHLSDTERNYDLYDRLIETGVRIPIEVPQRAVVNDGQLKILVDFLIGVDHWLTRNPTSQLCTILVVGSASESGIASLAYGVLQHMRYDCDFVLDLYDPYETERHYSIEWRDSVNVQRQAIYTHHRAFYNYDAHPEHKELYDILFDDAYVVGADPMMSHRAAIDSRKHSLKFRDYSIKRLVGDNDYFSSEKVQIYEQASKTKSGETRVVKYPRLYGRYNYVTLGRCSLCTEIQYMIRHHMYPSAIDYILMAHSKSCAPHQPRRDKRTNQHCCSGAVIHDYARLLQCVTHNSSLALYEIDWVQRHSNRLTPKSMDDIDNHTAISRDSILFDFSPGNEWEGVVRSAQSVPSSIMSRLQDVVVKYNDRYFVSILLENEVKIVNQPHLLFVCDIVLPRRMERRNRPMVVV